MLGYDTAAEWNWNTVQYRILEFYAKFQDIQKTANTLNTKHYIKTVCMRVKEGTAKYYIKNIK
jgi:hypothetical protein